MSGWTVRCRPRTPQKTRQVTVAAHINTRMKQTSINQKQLAKLLNFNRIEWGDAKSSSTCSPFVSCSNIFVLTPLITIKSTILFTGQSNLNTASPTWERFNRVARLCNRAEFRPDQAEDMPILRREATGDASESAIFKFTELQAPGVVKYRELYEKIVEIPFNSTNKYQVMLNRSNTTTMNNYRMIFLMDTGHYHLQFVKFFLYMSRP